MIGREKFLNIMKIWEQFDKKTDEFNHGLEKTLGVSFDKGETDWTDENAVWCYWGLDGFRKVIEQIFLDCGETKEGAEYWLFEGFDMITSGSGTEISCGDITFELNNWDEVYDYLLILNNENNEE